MWALSSIFPGHDSWAAHMRFYVNSCAANCPTSSMLSASVRSRSRRRQSHTSARTANECLVRVKGRGFSRLALGHSCDYRIASPVDTHQAEAIGSPRRDRRPQLDLAHLLRAIRASRQCALRR